MTALNIEQVEMLNKKAQQLNAQRQQMIGAQESARQTFDKSTFAYKQKYGVTLDDSNLQQEYNTVSTQMQTEYEALNSAILNIESGEYKNQGQVAQPVAQQPVQPPVQQFAQTPPPVNADVLAQINNQQLPPVQQFGGFAQPPVSPIQQPVVPVAPTQTTFVPPIVPTQHAQSAQDVQPTEDVSEQAFAPAGWGAPAQDVNQNFNNILGTPAPSGKQFS